MSEVIKIEQQNTQIAQAAQPMRLIELAITQNADIEKLEKLMALQERWDAQQAKKSFLAAMSSFQRNCPVITKAKQGHNYQYAPLSDIAAQIRDVLASNGLSYRFEQNHEAGIQVTCIVSHNDGHSESTTMKAGADTSGSKNAIQAIGSTVQYLMRYTLIGGLGITTADADMDGRLPDDTGFVGRDEVMELVAIMCDEHGQVTPKGQKLWSAVKLKDWESITEKQYKKIKQMAGAV